MLDEEYMKNTLEKVVKILYGIPDLSCIMLRKICKMMLACIEVYHKAKTSNTPWLGFLEGSQGLAYNLNEQPSNNVLHDFFARLMFLPSYYMQTFEEAFYTGFFTYKTRIFGLEVANLRVTYVNYMAMELKNKVANFPLTQVDAQRQYEFIDSM